MTIEFAKLDIWAIADADEKEGFKLRLVPPEYSWYMGSTDVKVGTTSVQYMPPDNMSREEMCIKAVATLKEKQVQVRARAELEINKLEARIQELLLLTYNPNGEVIPIYTVNAETEEGDKVCVDVPF